MTDSIVQLPVGTPVTFWPGEIKGPGRKGRIRSEVWTVGGQPVRADPITTWTDQTAVNGYGPAAEVAS